MTWIDLGNPVPRQHPERYELIQWDVGEIFTLPALSEELDWPFSKVLNARISQREFGILDDKQLGTFLWNACRTRAIAVSELGFDLEHRASPSAGAIHPIHIVIKRPGDGRWWLYQPKTHEMAELKNVQSKLSPLYERSLSVLEGNNATRILFLAETGKTLGKYQDGCSLIWRDAGALLAVMAFVAAAQGLNFCPLGITGEPWASNLAEKGKLAGVGLALLGSPLGD
ncbi:nitroreductase family protein [Shewanella baltica]|uniref:nitroreductase family protein n=1 Tax=Shewanella baltica TaxID=62322 RepID=UPI00217E966D|nr:nitroreductase family protein [Shewanella baltica]MCS6193209.1 dehydrogenase [Shewanella baltica]